MSQPRCDGCRSEPPAPGAYWQQKETGKRPVACRQEATMYSPYIVEDSQDRYQAQLNAREAQRLAKLSRQAQRGSNQQHDLGIGRALAAFQQHVATWFASGKPATPAEEIR